MKNILVFNAGSSSLKFSLFEDCKKKIFGKYEELKSKREYQKAFKEIYSQLNKKVQIDVVLHRVVHGGELKSPAKIDKKVEKEILKFSKFAPLHNSLQLKIIKLSKKFKVPQYAIFDTSYFASLPELAKTYAIPKEISQEYSIRRYGFHGISHEAASKNLKGKTISCHLGKGSSITASLNGKAIDTSMGLTPLEGVVMCTRSGSLDPGLVLFLEKKFKNLDKILNKNSGLKAISGKEDFREILKNLKQKDSRLAYEMFVYSLVKQIGAYVGVLEGLDNLVFTGQIGINVPRLRKDICDSFKFLEIFLDSRKNELNKELISSSKSKVKVWIKKDSEDLAMVEKFLK